MRRQAELIIGSIIIATGIIVGFWLIREVLGQALGSPVIVYRSAVVAPFTSMLCPGDMLAYRQQAEILDAPTVARLANSIWSVADERTVYPDDNPRIYNYSKPAVVNLYGSHLVPDLPAGAYELRVSSSVESRQSSMFVVPFVVKADC